MKLIAFDLDGTLIQNDHKSISDRNMRALEYAKKEDIILVPISGRVLSIIPDQLVGSGLASYIVTSNGAVIKDVTNNKNIYTNYIPSWQAKRVLHMVNYMEIPIELQAGGQMYTLESHLKYMKNIPPAFMEHFKNMNVINDILTDIPGEIEKIVINNISSEEYSHIEKVLTSMFPLSVIRMGNESMEINNRGVNKGAALRYLCKYLDIESYDVMTFGDDNNDIEMLQWADWSFAMDNGIDSAKKAAKYIAPSNVSSGVAQMIEKYALLC